jgi:G3E family GTPase
MTENFDGEVRMHTPVVLVAGQGDTDRVAGTLMSSAGTAVIGHEFDGQVVRRWVSTLPGGVLVSNEMPLELSHGCISCTMRDDLLVMLRRLHRRGDVTRIVVLLAPWLEPEPVCWAINHTRVRVGPGFLDGPAARDVRIQAVVTCIDAQHWLGHALGEELLDDGRTAAQVVVGQAEFADVLVPTQPDPVLLAVLRRLAPRSRITVGGDLVDMALRHLEPDARCGREPHPHDPLLAGQPPLNEDGAVALVEFTARRPFYPERLHGAIDVLLDGVVRARGRAWLATQPEHVMWIESAGAGLHIGHAGIWLAAMTSHQLACVDPQRRALANVHWDKEFGDRHVSMTILVCGARPGEVTDALRDALLTDEEMSRPGQWARYPDPFGDWHHDPCLEPPPGLDNLPARGHHDGTRGPPP